MGAGEISVADEHVATEISIRVLALEREARRVARVRPAYLAMLAAPPGELHVVALRMVANVLRDAGYDVMLVGADVPAEALAAMAARHQPDIVCLSATMPGSTDQLLITMDEVQRAWPKANFVIGGRGSPRGCRHGPASRSASASPTPSMPSTRWCRALA